jgi:hypothetical protein
VIIKHNTTVINDIIIEQNVKGFDPRWIARGAFCDRTRTWIMNIPKNGSNSIGRLIAPGNRPRTGWRTEQSYAELGTPDDRFIVVLRNPIERFAGSLAQHYVIRLEHHETLRGMNHSIDSLEWITDSFDDMHIWPQFTYLHGIPWYRCQFITMSDLTDLPGTVGIADNIQNWNITEDDDAKYATKKRIQAIIDTHPEVKKHLTEYYKTDTQLIHRALGKIPNR